MVKDKIRERLKKLCKTDDDKFMMIETMMGMSAVQSLYISKNMDTAKLPIDIHYAIVSTAYNMMAISSDSELAGHKNLGEVDLPPKEKLIEVLNHFVEFYKDELSDTGAAGARNDKC